MLVYMQIIFMFRIYITNKKRYLKKKKSDMIGGYLLFYLHYIEIFYNMIISDSEYVWGDTDTEISEKLTITDFGCDFCARRGIVCIGVKICSDCIQTELNSN